MRAIFIPNTTYDHSSTVQTEIPGLSRHNFSLIQCMVTAIQADQEEFFMCYFYYELIRLKGIINCIYPSFKNIISAFWLKNHI